jgi:hypothetical protein
MIFWIYSPTFPVLKSESQLYIDVWITIRDATHLALSAKVSYIMGHVTIGYKNGANGDPIAPKVMHPNGAINAHHRQLRQCWPLLASLAIALGHTHHWCHLDGIIKWRCDSQDHHLKTMTAGSSVEQLW